MKKLILLFMLVFLVGLVSAADFDDWKTYDNKEREYTITNYFRLGKEIGTIQLITPDFYNVGYGNQRIAEFEINNGDYDYGDIIKGTELYNVKNDMKEVIRDIYYKYKTTEEYSIYGGVCVPDVINGTLCSDVFIETRERVVWKDFTKNSLIKGEIITIGIYTEVYKGDTIEWVSTVYGNERLTEWAIFNASIDVGLVAAYPHNESSGTNIADYRGFDDNGTTTNMEDGDWTGSALDYDGSDEFSNQTNLENSMNESAAFSIAYNVVFDSVGGGAEMIMDDVFDGSLRSNYEIILTSATNLSWHGEDDGGWGSPCEVGGVPDIDGGFTFVNGVNYTIVHVVNESGVFTWINGVFKSGITCDSSSGSTYMTGGLDPIFGRAGGGGSYLDGKLGPVFFWNRSLQSAEVTEIIGRINKTIIDRPSITLNTPIDALSTTNDTILFNGTVSDREGFVNVSLFIDGVLNETNSSGINNTDYLFIKTLDFGVHNWTYESCDEVGCSSATVRTFTISKFVETSQTFNSSSFETASEGFTINITTASGVVPTGAELIYNGVTHTSATVTSTGGNFFDLSKTIDIPLVPGILNFTFNFTLSSVEYNTTPQSQLINISELGLCNSTLISPYINFTFKDEADNSLINATIDSSTWTYWLGSGGNYKTLLFSNNTVNNFYVFCFKGGNRTLYNTRSVQYASVGYPQRKYDASSDLTNTTTNKILWLLSSSDGIYSSIQVVDSKGDRVSGVGVTAERQFSGVWTIIGQEVTDDAGSVTFWLNPDYDHRFTFTSDDCIGASVTIRPTQTQYTQQLQCDGTGEDFVSQLEGIKYSRTPIEGIIQTGITNFTYFITSSKYTITNASFRIVNTSNSVILNSTDLACASDECLLYFTYNVPSGADIKGKYYVDIGNGSILLEGDAHWVNVAIDTEGKAGLSTFWNDLRYVLDDWGEGSNTGDFNRLVVIFFFMCLTIAFFNYHFNIDTQNPGAFMYILTVVIVSGSLVGGLDGQGFFYFNNLSSIQFINNYILAFLMIVISVSYLIQVNTQAKR